MCRAKFEKDGFQNEKKPWSKNRTKRVFKGNIVSVRGWKLRNASREIAPTFLSSAQDGGEGSTSRSSRFISRKEPRYPPNRRPGGFRSRSGRLFGEKLWPGRIRNPGCSARSRVCIPSTLFRLLQSNVLKR